MDARAWIVLPFENVAKAPDLDWLRDGSANLLYLDLSRWTDVRVVDDERVADLLLELSVPAGRPPTLTEGLAVARRAGARHLVMGDVLRAGGRVALVAKVFDARDGRRLRSVREEVSAADSMFAAFSRLARGVLDVAPPPGANVGALGAVSVDAYKEYLAGTRALNALDLPSAQRRLGRAVELDSTFALAHYKLALSLLWGSNRNARGRRHAEKALQLSTTLPARERTLIKAFSYYPRDDFGAMCETLAPLVRSDTTDVEALAGMADCLYHDEAIVPTTRASTTLRFRGSWNESFRLFRRVLDLDPTYHLAYQHLVDGYLSNDRFGQPSSGGSWIAFTQRDADSLLLVPMPMVFGGAAHDSGYAELGRSRSKERNVRAALAIAREWIDAAPNEPRAHRAAARAYAALGELAMAERHLRRGMQNLGFEDSLTASVELFDLRYRQFRVEGLSRFADSLTISGPGLPAADLPQGAIPRAATGRLSGLDSLQRRLASNSTALLMQYRLQLTRAEVGLPADSAVALEQRLPGSASTTVRTRPSFSIALRAPRAKWPAFDSVSYLDLRRRASAALARNDTASLRLAARALDSAAHAGYREFLPDRGFSMVSAESYLALRDSVNALRMVRWVLDTAVNVTPFNSNVDYAAAFGPSMPRIMLLRADLAAALGRADEARLWYKRLLDLWADADPEFQPLVDRIRRAYLALGAV